LKQTELALYQQRPDLWALALFFRQTKKIPRWKKIREMIAAELIDQEKVWIRDCIADARRRGIINDTGKSS
jgi:hypothetical protein